MSLATSLLPRAFWILGLTLWSLAIECDRLTMATRDAVAEAAIPSSRRQRFIRRIAVVSVALSLAAALWLPCLHFFYRPRLEDYASPAGLPPKARALAARHLALWDDPALRAAELRRMGCRHSQDNTTVA